MQLQLIYWGVSSSIHMKIFSLVQQLPSAIPCQIPFSHCLILDARDSHLLLKIRIVSFWYLRFILNFYTNKNIHF